MDLTTDKGVFEGAAQVILESYSGAGAWKDSTPDQRSQARQAVRKMLAAFEKNGLRVEGLAEKETKIPPPPPSALKTAPAKPH